MKDEICNLEQRMISTYLDTFPEFYPAESGCDIGSQKELYELIKSIYILTFKDPLLLVKELHTDDAHSNRFNKGQDKKPKLRENMRKVVKEMDSFLNTMYSIGRSGVAGDTSLKLNDGPRINKKQQFLLEKAGIKVSVFKEETLLSSDAFSRVFEAWIWMATRPGASLFKFSRCLFMEGYPYSEGVFSRLSGDVDSFQRLTTHLMNKNYQRLTNWDAGTSLDYYKWQDEQQPLKGGFLYGVRYIGISMSYDNLVFRPAVYALCIPKMRNLLLLFSSMEQDLKDFVVERAKKCDGCRYCVQTDKSGKRELAKIAITNRGTKYYLCPYFPGCSFCWEQLDTMLVDKMILMLDFMDMNIEKLKS